MKFDVLNRWTGNIQFTAEIECGEDAASSIKLGLAIKWGVSTNAYLRGADLRGANLSDADLRNADLRSADLSGADLRNADLRGAYLSGANLSDADLRNADLRSADLRNADLRSANLSDANLSGANLRGAYLSGAGGVVPEFVQPLLILLEQPGKIRAYKLVNENNTGPYYPGIAYIPGNSVSVESASVDVDKECAFGISVATLDWCLKNYAPGYKILVVEFEAADIAAIPTTGDGKFRLFRCDVISEKELDYRALGLLKD